MFNIALYCKDLSVLLLVTTLCKKVCNKSYVSRFVVIVRSFIHHVIIIF